MSPARERLEKTRRPSPFQDLERLYTIVAHPDWHEAIVMLAWTLELSAVRLRWEQESRRWNHAFANTATLLR